MEFLNNKIWKPQTILSVIVGAALVTASTSFGQNILFHLLKGGLPAVSFTTTAQNFNESNGAAAPWPAALEAWAKRRQIVLNGSTGSVTNYSMLLKIDSTKIDYAAAGTGGISLRFADDAGTLLNFEIESWDPAGVSYVWVKVPSIPAYPARSSIWMYYGNGAASSGQSPTAAWDTAFKKVVNFNGVLGAITHGATVPSTVGANAVANNSGAGMSYVAGTTGTGIVTDGTDDWIDLAGDVGFNVAASSPFTFAVSVKTVDSSGPIVSLRKASDPNTVVGLHIGYNGATTNAGRINVLFRDATGALYAELVGPAINDGQWHRVMLSRNAGGVIALHVDGVSYGTASAAGTSGALSTDLRSLGSERYWVVSGQGVAGDRFLAATFDEFRFATSQLSLDWMATNILASQDALALFQPEELVASGKAVITAQLNATPISTVTVPYTVTGTATSGSDFGALSGTLVIAAGNTTGTISVNVLTDNVTEASETVIVTMGTPTGATAGTNKVHTVTILDEPPAPPIAVNDTYNLTTITPQTFAVLANDTDANGDALSITAVTTPTGGGTAVRTGSTIAYTPPADFPASETFTYTISDGNGGTSNATVTVNFNIPFVWTGATSSAWATGTNWIGGAAPGVGDTATFNNACSTNCNPVIAANISVGGIRINSSYAGTLTQPAGLTITTAAGGWTQRGGTFAGGNSAVTIGGNLVVTGGTFTATSATTTISTGDVTVTGTPVFSPNGGTFTFYAGYGTTRIIQAGSFAFNNVNFTSVYGNFNLNGSTMRVNGLLTAGDNYGASETNQQFSNGTVQAYGNVSIANHGYRGDAVFELMGNASGQTVTGISGRYLPGLKISAGANAVTLVGEIGIGTGSFNYASASSVALTGTTLTLYCAYGRTCVITPGPLDFNNVTLNGFYTTYSLGGATMKVLGTLTMGDTYGGGYTSQPINNGTFDARGNVVINNSGYRGTSAINVTGASNTTLSHTASAGTPTGLFVVNKDTTATKMTLSSNVLFYTAGQSMTVTQGTVDLAGFTLAMPATFTVGAAAKIICNGGTLTVGTAVITGEISCGSSIGISWTGATGDGLWSTAGNWTNNTVPGATDIAIFNGACSGANCNVTIDSSLSVKGILMTSAYAGTVTQGAAATLTVGSSGFLQAAGTFIGSTMSVTVNGRLSITGGTFNSTSGTLQLGSDFTVAGGTFVPGTGLVSFYSVSTSSTIIPSAVDYNDVTFGGSSCTQVITGTMKVAGTLTVTETGGGQISSGTIEAKGNVNITGNGKTGAAIVKIAGSGNQTVTGVATGQLPIFEIASTGGTVTLAGTLYMTREYRHTSGTVDAGTSTILFGGYFGTVPVVPSTTVFNNVSFLGQSVAYPVTGTMTVGGALVLNDAYASGTINGGTISAKGSITVAGANGYIGTGKLIASGNSDQLITGSATGRFPNFELASTGGTVTLAGTLNFGLGYKYVSGVVDAGTSTLAFYNNSATTQVWGGTPVYNNVYFDSYAGIINLNDTMEVGGTTVIRGTTVSPYAGLNTGTILARGNVTFNTAQGMYGTALVKMAGAGNQTLSFAGGLAPSIEFASTGGTVTVTGTALVRGNFTYTSGTVDMTTSTMIMNHNTTGTLSAGALNFYNLRFEGYVGTHVVVGTPITTGTLSFYSTSGSPASTITGGPFEARGNVTYNNYGVNGTAPITMTGTSSAQLQMQNSGSRMSGNITIDKTGGASVTMSADAPIIAASQALTIANGNLDLNGYVATINGALSIAATGTLTCNGGVFTSGSLSNSGVINCPGYSTYPFNWTGTTADGNWNTAGNWQGGVVPTSTSVVVFDNAYCGANCNVLMNSTVNIKGLHMFSGYSGTITQGTGVTVTVGNRGWTQVAGNFVGSNAAITMNGAVALSGGSFTSTSTTLTAAAAWSVTGTAAFVANSGTFVITVTGTETKQIFPGSVEYNNVQFTGSGSSNSFNLNAGTMKVLGSLTLNHSANLGVNNGTLDVKGNVSVPANANVSSVVIKISGNTDQTLTPTTGVHFGRLNIASTGGTVSVAGNLIVRSGFTYTSGTVDWGTNTLIISPGTSTVSAIVPGTLVFTKVEFAGGGSSTGYDLNGGTMNVTGLLTLNNTSAAGISNGTIAAKSDVTLTASDTSGSALIKIAGAGNQTITAVSTSPIPGLEIASTGGTVTVSGTLNVYRQFTYTSGTVSWGTSTLNLMTTTSRPIQIVPGAITYPNVGLLGGGSGGEHNLNGGTLLVGGNLTLNSNSTGGMNNGTVNARGNFDMVNASGGTMSILFSGSAAQTISRTAGTWPTGTRVVNKTGGSITQTSAITVGGANPLTITTGSWFMAGYALTVPGLTLNSNTLTKGTGVLTVNGSVAGTGPLFGGTVAP